LNETTGPKARVSGARSSVGTGAVADQARFSPVGAHARWVNRGFRPWPSACGHQESDHTNTEASVGAEDRIRVDMWARIFGPNSRSETDRYRTKAPACWTVLRRCQASAAAAGSRPPVEDSSPAAS